MKWVTSGSMDAGLGGWTANDADGLARAFAGAGIGLGALPANRQAAQVANATIALDALQSLEVHANLAAEIAFDDVFAILNGVDNLRELLLRQIFGADGRIYLRLAQDFPGVGGANAVNVTKRDVDALVRWNFDANDTSHISLNGLNWLHGRLISPAAAYGGGWYRSPG